MSQTTADDGLNQVELESVSEGDTLKMAVQPHGEWLLDRENVSYNSTEYSVMVEGTVTYMPKDRDVEQRAEGVPVMANFTIETDNGDSYTWHLDNGYVIGPNEDNRNPDRTDVARFIGLYE